MVRMQAPASGLPAQHVMAQLEQKHQGELAALSRRVAAAEKRALEQEELLTVSQMLHERAEAARAETQVNCCMTVTYALCRSGNRDVVKHDLVAVSLEVGTGGSSCAGVE